MEFELQDTTTRLDKRDQNWQLHKAARLLEKLGSWKETSIGFASIINSNSSFINQGINELVEEICSLKAQLKTSKDEKTALIQTVRKLKKANDEIWNLNSKCCGKISKGKGPVMERQDIKEQDSGNQVQDESKYHELTEDQVEEFHSERKDESDDSLTTNSESTTEMANEDVDDPESTKDALNTQQEEPDETKEANEKEEAPLYRKKFQCDICGYASAKNNIRDHKFEVHKIGKKEFICDSCPSKFKSSAGLMKHKEWRHTDNHHKYECDLCSYDTTFVKELRKHMKRAHKNQDSIDPLPQNLWGRRDPTK